MKITEPELHLCGKIWQKEMSFYRFQLKGKIYFTDAKNFLLKPFLSIFLEEKGWSHVLKQLILKSKAY